jgi:hypothetical protein
MLELRQVADFFAELGTLAVLRPSLDAAGAAVLTCTETEDLVTALGTLEGREINLPSGKAASRYPLTVLHYRNGRWIRAVEVEVDTLRPQAQVLADGSVLVVGANSRRDLFADAVELNATVYASDGTVRSQFLVGDGVADVRVATSGEIWVSYGSEGIMGDYGYRGWGRISPRLWIEPIGAPGLVRFDLEGGVTYEFVPPSGFKVMGDCYALNAWGTEAWCCYHPDFAVTRSGLDGSVAGWSTELSGIDALAVDGSRILVHAGTGGDHHRCHTGRLNAGVVTDLTDVVLALPGEAGLDSLRWMVGWGSSLHGFTETGWYRLDAADWLKSAG